MLAVWAAVALLQVRSAAAVAADRVRDVQAGVATGQTSAALAAARSAAVHTARAHDSADALPLRLASHLPLIGPPLIDARTLVAATDTAVREGAVPLLGVADTLVGDGGRAVRRPDGSVDPALVAQQEAIARRAATRARAAEDRAAAVDVARLPSPLRASAAQARDGITALAAVARRTDAALAAGGGPEALAAEQGRASGARP